MKKLLILMANSHLIAKSKKLKQVESYYKGNKKGTDTDEKTNKN